MNKIAYLDSSRALSRGSKFTGKILAPIVGSRVEDQPLPIGDLPEPRPLSVAEIAQQRDGSHCRICTALLHSEHDDARPNPRLVNLLPGHPAGEKPELGIVLACQPCADDVVFIHRNPDYSGYEQLTLIQEARKFRILQRTLKLLYLENCSMANLKPLEVVTR
ncbi:hypothetical protein M3B43_12015 [Nesterenkonia massiliensis]|uniref:HNH endonuclease n=1 Tax=Nesterenkonia massiliensis TaxID=1232429 RepID=A0ABT2HTK2_9MICC|nr:hypothetical protein [Nesterenkonia massiliensis]MCT1608023.1 hypothetical protein [Nesterenkonia massiliensis]